MVERFDVVIVGSGAAALAAAVVAASRGSSVVVLERAPLVGGTSAFSGGMAWIPGSSHFAELGSTDSADAARMYIRGLTQGRQYDDHLIDVFVENAPEAIDYLEKVSPVVFQASRSYTDYFADHEGGTKGGRSLDAIPFNARAGLGEWLDKLRTSPHFPMPLTLDEMVGASGADPRNANAATMTSNELRNLVTERSEAGVVANGCALVASLLAGALQHGVQVRIETRARELVLEDGRVTGVIAETGGGPTTYAATRGVVLASGGFEWNPDLVLTYLGITRTVPLSPPGNEGDALLMALPAGAAVANMTAGWNYPCTLDPAQSFEGQPRGTFGSTRFEAGSIALNSAGRRFVNEAAQYADVPKAFWKYDEVTQSYPSAAPAHLIFDQRVRDRVVVNDLRPGDPTPPWVVEADSLVDLAKALDLDPDVVVAEVGRFNANAENGVDPDFGRGTVWFEGQTRGGPSPKTALAPISAPPFYAMEFHHGLLGTAGGLRVNEKAQVLNTKGEPIAGLHACGNTAASIFGPMYPGGGTSIGVGLTFGYLAGLALGAPDTASRGDDRR